MTAVVLDTTVLIDYTRGRPTTIARVQFLAVSGVELLASAVNVEELYRGIRESERASAELLLSALAEAPIRFAEATVAGEWRRAFAERGVTLSQPDCLVAAAASAVGARLATGNPKDFPMDGLTVEHWPVGQ